MDTTVNALLDRYVVELLPKCAERTQRDYLKYTLPALRRRWGERIADEILPREFGEYLWSSPRGQIQRTRELAPLGAAYRAGKGKWWMVTSNPLADLQKPKNPPRDHLITMDEFNAMVAMAPHRIGLIMKLALRTGQRQGDVLSLRWDQIKDMEIHIQQSKTKKRLAIIVDKALEAVLDECYRLPEGGCSGGAWVVPSSTGRRYSSEGFRAMYTRVQRQYAAQGGRRSHFHDIRALAATMCPDVESARRLLGHTTVAMTARVYRRGVERVEALKC